MTASAEDILQHVGHDRRADLDEDQIGSRHHHSYPGCCKRPSIDDGACFLAMPGGNGLPRARFSGFPAEAACSSPSSRRIKRILPRDRRRDAATTRLVVDAVADSCFRPSCVCLALALRGSPAPP